MLDDVISPYGRVVLEFTDPLTGEVVERREFKNTTTNQFKAAIAGAIAGTPGTAPSHIGFYGGGSGRLGTSHYNAADYTTLNGSSVRIATHFVTTSVTNPTLMSFALYMQRVGVVNGPLKAELWTDSGGWPSTPAAFFTSVVDLDPYKVGALGPNWVFFTPSSPIPLAPIATYWFVLYAPNHTHQANTTEIRIFRSNYIATSQTDRLYNGTSWTAINSNYLKTQAMKHNTASTGFNQTGGVDLGRYALTFQKASGTQARLGLAVPTSFSPEFPIMAVGLFNHPTSNTSMLAFTEQPFVKLANYGLNVYWLIDVT
jgi:hypothetical protein